MTKRTLQGFNGTKTVPGTQLNECLKQIGKLYGGQKGVRPVGGNLNGVTSGGKAASGSPKMDTMGGKGMSGGKGPAVMPKVSNSADLKKVGKVSTTKLSDAKPRVQP